MLYREVNFPVLCILVKYVQLIFETYRKKQCCISPRFAAGVVMVRSTYNVALNWTRCEWMPNSLGRRKLAQHPHPCCWSTPIIARSRVSLLARHLNPLTIEFFQDNTFSCIQRSLVPRPTPFFLFFGFR